MVLPRSPAVTRTSEAGDSEDAQNSRPFVFPLPLSCQSAEEEQSCGGEKRSDYPDLCYLEYDMGVTGPF